MDELTRWVKDNAIAEVECLAPDLNGILRGKVLPAAKLLQARRDGALRLPSSVFAVTVTGEYADVDGDEEADTARRLFARARPVLSWAMRSARAGMST
jgi:glutamine synthetase